MSGRQHIKAEDVPLIPMGEFNLAAKKILSNTMAESSPNTCRFRMRFGSKSGVAEAD